MAASRRASIVLALVAVLAGAALADDPGGTSGAGDGARPHVYVGLGGHCALPDFGLPGVRADDGQGLSARVGYRSHPNLGFDLVFDWVSPYALRNPSGARIGEVESHAVTGNVKLYPFTGRIQPYLTAGVGLLAIRSESRFASRTQLPVGGRFGAGVDVYLDPHLALSVEGVYEPPLDSRIDDLPFALVGGNLQYHW
jgi:opacity protein-like surface antigen